MTITESEMFEDQYLTVGNLINGSYEIFDWSGSAMYNRVGQRQYVEKHVVESLIEEGFTVEFV